MSSRCACDNMLTGVSRNSLGFKRFAIKSFCCVCAVLLLICNYIWAFGANLDLGIEDFVIYNNFLFFFLMHLIPHLFLQVKRRDREWERKNCKWSKVPKMQIRGENNDGLFCAGERERASEESWRGAEKGQKRRTFFVANHCLQLVSFFFVLFKFVANFTIYLFNCNCSESPCFFHCCTRSVLVSRVN